MNFSPRLALSIVSLAVLTALPAAAQTLTFDDLGVNEPAFGTQADFSGTVYDGVTFNGSLPNNWAIFEGHTTFAGPTDYFAVPHSGDYYLAGSGYPYSAGGVTFTGLTISTTKALTSIYVGCDNNGGGSNDSDSVTITAFGASGDLGSISSSTIGNEPAMTFLDTSSAFGGLTGITGYRFVTDAANVLAAGEDQGVVVVDDMTFTPSNPVPEASTTVSFGLLLSLGLGGMVAAARKRRSA